MRNFNVKADDNFDVVIMLNGLRLAELDMQKRLDEAKEEGSRVDYYEMKLREIEALYARMDVVWQKNHYNAAKRYAGDDERSKAELRVERIKLEEANARLSLAKIVYEESEKAWLKS